MSGRVLTRGWTEDLIRRAVHEASDNARAVLVEIADHRVISTEEIADNLGLRSPNSVRSVMAGWTRGVTGPLGVVDPATGRES